MKKLIILFLLASCATTAKYEKILDSWVGHTTTELSADWGYPSGSFKAPSGNTIWIYSSSSAVAMPTYTTTNVTPNYVGGYNANSTTSGGGIMNLNCMTYFESNDNQRIVSWSWKGNSCTSR
tara:strand:- start:39721 stop:40086 length:366 start_codon:yes stop_codon:yes gene_type:complete